jgi:hypothetical protein
MIAANSEEMETLLLASCGAVNDGPQCAVVQTNGKLKASIYGLVFKDTGCLFLGASTSLEERERSHRRALEDGKHVNQRLQEAYNLDPDGMEFRVMHTFWAASPQELVAVEAEWLEAASRDYGDKLLTDHGGKASSFVGAFRKAGLLLRHHNQ